MENLNPVHHVIEVFSNAWWIMNISLIIIIISILFLTKNKSISQRETVAKVIALVLFIDFVFNQALMYYSDKWLITYSLPLELCSLSVFLGIYILLSKSQIGYELLICWSAGAVHSFLTPEITTGGSLINHIDYTISHGGILLSGFYATTRLGYRPRPKSWLTIFYYSQLLIPIIGFLDFYLNANYMYLRIKPLVDNPFIIGDWPYYIIGLEFVALTHFYLSCKLHEWLSKKSSEVNSV